MSNTDRARRAAQNALDAYLASDGISNGNEIDSTIADLIADLMHLADSLGVDGSYVQKMAAEFYCDELQQ